MAVTRAKFAHPGDEVDCAPGGFGIHTSKDTVPGAPTIGTAVTGNDQASVAFTAPADKGSGITFYRATSTPGGITEDGAASPIVVTGLTGGTPYTFKVKAHTDSGFGPESAASNSVTPT